MGYRWYKGRFVSDGEYNDILRNEMNDFFKSVGILSPTVFFGLIGYAIGGNALWIGIVLGLILGFIFNRLFVFLTIFFVLGTVIYVLITQ